jgi:hypothetical protein
MSDTTDQLTKKVARKTTMEMDKFIIETEPSDIAGVFDNVLQAALTKVRLQIEMDQV